MKSRVLAVQLHAVHLIGSTTDRNHHFRYQTHLFTLELRQDLLTLRLRIRETSHHVESSFWETVTLTTHDLLERTDGVLQVDQNASYTYTFVSYFTTAG